MPEPTKQFIVSCPHCRGVVHWYDDEEAHRAYLESLKPKNPAHLIPPVYVGKWGAPPSEKGAGDDTTLKFLQRSHEHLGEQKVFPMKCPHEGCGKVIVAMLRLSNEQEIVQYHSEKQNYQGKEAPKARWRWVALTSAQFVAVLNAEKNPIVRASVKGKLFAAGWLFGGVEAEEYPRPPPRRS